jgi:hypothetical protein
LGTPRIRSGTGLRQVFVNSAQKAVILRGTTVQLDRAADVIAEGGR